MDTLNILNSLQDKISAFVYCQRDRTHDVFNSLQKLQKCNSIQVFCERSFLLESRLISIFWTNWRPQTKALRMNWRTSISFNRKKVTVPQ